jgi:predicted ATPase/DNA-binding winged helix-turn-helix (wHTH) protein
VTKIYEIGPFRLDAEAAVLTQAGVPVALGSRAVAVLTTLVERSNEYVQKGAIMDAAWPGVVVEESNLAVQISAIRHVLAQAPGGERWIETLARRGYRFVGPVTELRGNLPQGAVGGRQRSNLPASLTSFVGRERELVEIKRLLPVKRLLTLVGVGGIGKTRLALQVAAEVMDAYRDGVWLVELGSIRDPLLVATSVAQVLGVQETTGKPLTDTLCAHLKARQLLLILDNCEHLLDACATLADAILRTAAEPTILATSREPLHVPGEQTYPLQTLSLAEPSASAEVIGRSEAVQLFVERARQQLPDFELSAARAAAVAELCIHLDGIPLALELAAARVRSLSIEQINARLNDRFRLLTSGTRTALPRQHTLRATLDWSYDLLGEQERAVLRRLAVFAGGFTLEAASAVASDDAIDEFAVIDLLSQLVERSLVVADTNDAGARYRLLETTRAYALEKLAEAEEMDASRRRHAQHFQARFEHAYDEWLRMADADWRVVYTPELGNVRAALDWSLGADGEPAIGIALAAGSGPMWAMLSLFGEGAQRLKAAVETVPSDLPDSGHAPLWLWLGVLLAALTPAQAVTALQRAIDGYRSLGSVVGLGHSLVYLGRMYVLMGKFEQAEAVLAEAFPVVERSEVRRVIGSYHAQSGFLKMVTGDSFAARTHFEKAFTLYRDAGAEDASFAMRGTLGDLSWTLGDLDIAKVRLLDTIAQLRKSRLARKERLGTSLTNLAGVYTERGELDEALTAAREGLPLLKDSEHVWYLLDHLALRAALAGKLANAARLAGYADSAVVEKQSPRQPNEARAYARLQTLLREKLAPDELERLLSEGAKMSDDEACRLALED